MLHFCSLDTEDARPLAWLTRRGQDCATFNTMLHILIAVLPQLSELAPVGQSHVAVIF
jgi:hypothetical protein